MFGNSHWENEDCSVSGCWTTRPAASKRCLVLIIEAYGVCPVVLAQAHGEKLPRNDALFRGSLARMNPKEV